MDQRILGKGGLVASALGLGCMGLSQGYGPVDEEQAIQVIRQALDCGITLIDTAMSYGEGQNERLLGRAIAGRREQAIIATKFGIVREGQNVRLDASPDRVQGDCEASLARLGIETIDLYYLHRADPTVPVAETIGAMARLVEAGKVRYLGVSELRPDQIEEASRVHAISAVQFEWSLLWRAPESDVVPVARRLGIGLVPYSPLGRGLLTATLAPQDIDASVFRRNDPRFHGRNLDRNLAQVAALKMFSDEYGVTAGQMALAWLLAQGPDVIPIPATRQPRRVLENAAAVDIRLTASDLKRLDQIVPPSSWAGDRHSFAVPTTTRGT